MRLKGTPVSRGVGIGIACRFEPGSMGLSASVGRLAEQEQVQEQEQEQDGLAAFRAAVKVAAQEISRLSEKLKERTGGEEAEILGIQLSLLDDPLWLGEIEGLISAGMLPHEAAAAAAEKFAAVFMSSGDRLLQERAADIRDVAARLAGILSGRADAQAQPAGVVLVAEELYPSLVAALDPLRVRGLVTGTGGYTSHAAIIARALGIPAVMGVDGALHGIEPGAVIVTDGAAGVVWINPDEAVLQEYRAKTVQRQVGGNFTAAAPVGEAAGACTKDGSRIELTANAGTPAEAKLARALGADGIGLYRTEYAYLERGQWPGEEELYAEYAAVAAAWAEGEAEGAGAAREVVFRTFDLGGDKLPGYLALPRQANPMLGLRGIRLYRRFPEHFMTQLKALLRTCSHGRIKIMIPMVSCPEEFRWASALLQEAQKITGSPHPSFGLMVEVPAVAVLLGSYESADFFSLGTNDLVQYALALDRTGAAPAGYGGRDGTGDGTGEWNYYHPGFLRILQTAVADAGAMGKQISICGEMAGDLRAVPLLLGLGVRSFSAGVDRLTDLRKVIGNFTLDECREITLKASQLATAQAVGELLNA